MEVKRFLGLGLSKSGSYCCDGGMPGGHVSSGKPPAVAIEQIDLELTSYCSYGSLY